MSLFQKLFSRKAVPPQTISTAPAAPPAPARPKTLAELEQEMEQQAQQANISVNPQHKLSQKPARLIRRVIWSGVLLGLPVGAIALANLPVAPIRDTVSDHAPMLLLPSYMSMDHNFRQAIALVQQARQLIDYPTNAADLELGAQQIAQAQRHLDALPVRGEDWEGWARDWSGWYDWRLTPLGLNQTRAEVGRLQARVFQEQTAQKVLTQTEQSLQASREQFQQPASEAERITAIADWQVAIDQLRQIAPETLAGKTAQQKLQSETRDFEAIAQQFAANQTSQIKIDAARQLAWQAVQLGQEAPHRTERWQQVQGLWEEAIAQLKPVSADDPAGYAQASRLLAEYQSNLSQIKIRLAEEQDSEQALRQAKDAIAGLQSQVPAGGTLEPGYVAAQVQRIVNLLEQVRTGTTAHAEAQQLLEFARNKLRQIQ